MNSRQKGKRGELEAVHLLRAYGWDARRGQQYSGANGDADVTGVPGVHLEIKRRERFAVYEWLNQALNDAKDGEISVVLARSNNKPWIVLMVADEFLPVLGEWINGNDGG